MTMREDSMLTVIDQKWVRGKNGKGGKTMCLCECECGNKKWIRKDSLKIVKSCGCLQKNTQFQSKDLTGKTFGRLKVLEPTDERKDGAVVWKCQCKCGNITFVTSDGLRDRTTSSCGCLWVDSGRKNIKKASEKLSEYLVDGTNIKMITRDKPISTNTSGYTGVRWDKSRNKWYVDIIFKGKYYYLGRYEEKADAIKARKTAENKLHGEFLDWYYANHKSKKGDKSCQEKQ